MGRGPGSIGLTVAIVEDTLLIGFHKDYIIEETSNAIAFSIDYNLFKEILVGVEKRRVN